MAIFNKEQSSTRRGPSEIMPLTETLSASLWNSEDENGQVRFHWDISRMSEDQSRTYKTMRVESLLEVPAFTARLSEAFANSSAIPAALREKLAFQAAALNKCFQLVETSGDRKVNGRDGSNRVFAV